MKSWWKTTGKHHGHPQKVFCCMCRCKTACHHVCEFWGKREAWPGVCSCLDRGQTSGRTICNYRGYLLDCCPAGSWIFAVIRCFTQSKFRTPVYCVIFRGCLLNSCQELGATLIAKIRFIICFITFIPDTTLIAASEKH